MSRNYQPNQSVEFIDLKGDVRSGRIQEVKPSVEIPIAHIVPEGENTARVIPLSKVKPN